MTQSATESPSAPQFYPPYTLPEVWHGAAAKPLEIDVGCHKGLFIVEMAQAHPTHNFLGIERQAKRVLKTGKKIKALHLDNADVTQGDGQGVLDQLPEGCADYIHVLFPHPWPKRRHWDRRMVQDPFFKACARVLKAGATLRIVTDHRDYWESISECIKGLGDFVKKEAVHELRSYPETEFQKKFLSAGLPIYEIELLRIK